MKMAKRTLSIFLALMMAFSVLSVASTAFAGADYTAVNSAIAAKIPSVDNRYFYTGEAVALINDVLNNKINWGLGTADQATVNGYVTMVNDLGAFLKTVVTDSTASPLTFAYGTGFSYAYTYPYGTDGLNFYPFRAEEKAVDTVALTASKSVVSLADSAPGAQNFTVTLSIGSNALICAGGIPILFDKTKLEVVGVDNAATNVAVTPTMIGSNLANEFVFTAVLNPDDSLNSFWPDIYKTNTVFRNQWAGISVTWSTNFNGIPYSIAPAGQENVLSIEFMVKPGAVLGDTVIYVDPNFKRDAYSTENSLYIGRGKNADSYQAFDQLATYGATIDTSAAAATVNIATYLLGDINNDTEINGLDARMALQYDALMITLSPVQILAGNVNLDLDEYDNPFVNGLDARLILQLDAGLITHF